MEDTSATAACSIGMDYVHLLAHFSYPKLACTCDSIWTAFKGNPGWSSRQPTWRASVVLKSSLVIAEVISLSLRSAHRLCNSLSVKIYKCLSPLVSICFSRYKKQRRTSVSDLICFDYRRVYWVCGSLILFFLNSNEYQIFKKIIALEYEFPSGFAEVPKDLVQSLLVSSSLSLL